MSEKRGDGEFLAGCIFAIFGFLVGVLVAALRGRGETVRAPETLEPILDTPPPKVPPPLRLELVVMGTGLGSLLFLSFGISTMLLPPAVGIYERSEGVIVGLVLLIIGGLLGFSTFRLMAARNQQVELAKPVPRGDPIQIDKARVYTITLPRKTPWQPEAAYHLIEQLLHSASRLAFRIVAEHSRISWQIVDLRLGVSPTIIEQAVRATYPDAEIDVDALKPDEAALPFYRYVLSFRQATLFLAPILYATDLKDFDPLVALTQGMSDLQPGERVVYTLYVSGFADWAYKEGEKLITQSSIDPFQFVSIGGWVDATLTTLARQNRVDRYVPGLQQVLREKLERPLLQALLLIQVDAPSRERVEQLAHMDVHVWQFERPEFNALAWYREPWPDSIRTIDTSRRDWVTSTLGLLDAWLTNRSWRWKDLRLILEPRELAALWHLPHEAFTAPKIAWSHAHRVALPAELAANREGLCLGNGWFSGRPQEVYIPDSDRATHINIVGKVGVGKSTLLHHLIHQDIAAGRGVGVIDPHGKLVRDILQASIPPGRKEEVVVLDLANEVHPPPLNPLGALPGGTRSYVGTGRIVSILEKLYGGSEHAPRMSNALRSALMTLRNQPQATVRDVVKLFLDEEYRHRMLAHEENAAVLDFWYEEYENFSEALQAQIREPVVYRVRAFYSNRDLEPIICHPDALDFGALMREGKIILISLRMDEERVSEGEKNLIGAMLVSQLQMAVMGKQALSEPFYLYIDEVQNFVTSALDRMFEEARKYLLSLTVAHQYLRQLAGPTLDALMGTVGATIAFQCGLDDARALAPYMKPGFDTEDLVNLDKFQAAVKMRYRDKTQLAFSLSTLEPLEQPADAEEREQEIRRISAAKYTPKTRTEVMAWLNERYPRPGGRQAAAGEEDSFYDPT